MCCLFPPATAWHRKLQGVKYSASWRNFFTVLKNMTMVEYFSHKNAYVYCFFHKNEAKLDSYYINSHINQSKAMLMWSLRIFKCSKYKQLFDERWIPFPLMDYNPSLSSGSTCLGLETLAIFFQIQRRISSKTVSNRHQIPLCKVVVPWFQPIELFFCPLSTPESATDATWPLYGRVHIPPPRLSVPR